MTSDTKGKEAGLLVRTKCMVKCVTQMVRFFWSFRGFVEGSKRRTREGVIIEWPLNGQFHDAVTDVLTPRTGISEVVVEVTSVL